MALVVQRQPIFTQHGEGCTQRKSPDASNASSGRGYTATTSAKLALACCFSLLPLLMQLRFKKFIMPPSDSPQINSLRVFAAPATNATTAVEATAQEGVVSSELALIIPNVLLVGQGKAGTTTVAHWLFSSRLFCEARTFDNEPFHYNKEVSFFNTDRFQHGKEFYAKRFEHCNPSDFVIDATPGYASYAKRIGDFYRQLNTTSSPDGCISSLKVMMILREPVSRKLSLYNHMKFNFGGTNTKMTLKKNYTSFDEYVDKELVLELTRQTHKGSLNSTQHIRQWFDVLKREQILILLYHELKNDPTTFQRRIKDFLGLSPNNGKSQMKTLNAKTFSGKEAVPSCQSRNKLAGIFQPHNKDLYALLAQNPGPPMEQRPFPEFEVAACHD